MTTCFMVSRTDRAARALRRYDLADSRRGKCPAAQNVVAGSYHQAMVRVEDGPLKNPDPRAYDGDPRWPMACPCGYEFSEADARQVFTEPIYADAEGHEWPFGSLPIGAMFDTLWVKDRMLESPGSWTDYRVGPDGLVLTVITPGGEWCIDRASSGGGFWTRSGTAPELVVTPSIDIRGEAGYHGWLGTGCPPGTLSDDLEPAAHPLAGKYPHHGIGGWS